MTTTSGRGWTPLHDDGGTDQETERDHVKSARVQPASKNSGTRTRGGTLKAGLSTALKYARSSTKAQPRSFAIGFATVRRPFRPMQST